MEVQKFSFSKASEDALDFSLYTQIREGSVNPLPVAQGHPYLAVFSAVMDWCWSRRPHNPFLTQ